jgi:hypothetical protein
VYYKYVEEVDDNSNKVSQRRHLGINYVYYGLKSYIFVTVDHLRITAYP